MTMSPRFARLIDSLSWTVAPGRCLLCGLGSDARRDLCTVCAMDLLPIEHPCPRCGLPMPPVTAGTCGRCRASPPPFDALNAACAYADPADLLVTALKFRKIRAAARVMAEIMVERAPADLWTDTAPTLVPVPLHFMRQWQRGFNQSAVLAEELARLTGWPVATRGIRRRRRTPAQTGLSRNARQRNLAGAFSVEPRHPLADVIMVDDVVTTGATLVALGRALRRAGARRVRAWAFARTPPGGSG